MDFEKDLRVVETNIPGLIVFDLPVHGDNRGWFKENWQRAKMTELGLPDFGPVQNNVSFNAKKGVTRGIHAEPWDKYISIATGSVFGAWVDLRPGESFGQVYTTVLDPSKAIYVPRGVGNSFQALEDGTAYTYLVNAHWSLEQKKTYTFVNLADPDLGIQWPIPLEESERSEADLHHPMLRDAKPMAPRRTMVTGCNGQLGHAIRDYVEEHGSRASSSTTSTRSTSPTRHSTAGSTGACTARSSTRARTPRSTGPRPRRGACWRGRRTRRDPPCWRACARSTTSPWCTCRAITCSTGPPNCMTRRRRSRRWACTASRRPPGTSRSRIARVIISCVRAG